MKDIIKTYEKELDDPRPMYVIMSDDGLFFKDHGNGKDQKIEITDDPALAYTMGNDDHAKFELVEYEKRFKKTKKKWRVVALYESKKITYTVTER
jgi:hypothetical protein